MVGTNAHTKNGQTRFSGYGLGQIRLTVQGDMSTGMGTFVSLLPVGTKTARANGKKLLLEVGLDPGTDIGWMCPGSTPLGGHISQN